tara:strand:- start:7718 stop:8458 length:741 start_codon:yes stop_codon:yes gene_type:complete
MKVILALVINLVFTYSAFTSTIVEKRNFVIEAKLSFLPKIPVMDIATVLSITKNEYIYDFSIRTNNIVEFINKVNGDGKIIGSIVDTYYKPLRYTYKYTRKEKEKFVEIEYKDSIINKLTLIPIPDQTKLTKVDKSMMINTIDPSTFFLNILEYKNTNNCDITFKVFDGKRRYNINFEKDNMSISNEYIFCHARQIKLGGYKVDDDEDVFASSDSIKIIYRNNDNKDFYGYEANNGSITIYINEVI